MAEQTSIAQGLTSILTPLATVGASVYSDQTKAQINAARIKAGKAPCTGLPDQPSDCPSIFASLPPGNLDQQSGTGSGNSGPPRQGVNPLVIIGLLVGLGVVVVMLLPKKKSETPAAARRRKRKR